MITKQKKDTLALHASYYNLRANLGVGKRILLSLLVFFIHYVYKTDAFAWTSLTGKTDTTCAPSCVSTGYWAGLMGNHMSDGAYGFYIPNAVSSICYCYTTAERTAMLACSTLTCGYSNTEGERWYNLTASTCSYDGCTCLPGYYRTTYGYGACTICPAGSYCTGSTNIGVQNGGKSVCTAGYYCPTGASTMTKCPSGRYTASTAQSTCSVCASGKYCPGGTASLCPAGAYCPGTGLSTYSACPKGYYCPSAGMTSGYPCPSPNPPATTATTGAINSTSCYIPANSEVSDDYGAYVFTSNCSFAAS